MHPIILWQEPITQSVPTLQELQPLIVDAILREESGRAAVFTLLLAAASVTVGQSLLLLANQVRPSRFLFSLFFAGLTFIATLGLWTATFYFVGQTYFKLELGLREVAIVVIASFSPLVNAYLGILPYVGSCIIRLLYVQSALLLFIALWALGFGSGGALLLMVLGLLVLFVGRVTILAPLYWLQNRVAGKTLQRRYRTIIAGSQLEVEP